MAKRFTTRGFLSWQRVRGFGELQILTRASYATLLIVPLLAGLWPAVRSNVESYNQNVVRVTEELTEAARRFSDAAAASSLPRPDGPPDGAQHLAARPEPLARLEREVTDFQRNVTLSDNMPGTWAVAFFASLAAVFGQLVYQFYAPEIVRRHTLEQHVSLAKEDFTRHPTDIALTTAAAEVYPVEFNEVRAIHEEMAAFTGGNIPDVDALYTRAKLLSPLRKRELLFFMERSPPPGVFEQLKDELREKIIPEHQVSGDAEKLDIIEKAARQTYQRQSETARPAIAVAIFAYAVAVALILVIVVQQAGAVATAAGWLPLW